MQGDREFVIDVIYVDIVMTSFVSKGINSTEERDLFIVCVEENFGKTIIDCSNCSRLENTPKWILVLHSIANVAQILASFIFCALVLVLVLKYKKLQRRAIIVSLSLIAADVFLVCSYHLPAFASTVIVKWPFKFIGCEVFGFLSTDFTLTRWYMMSVLSADRFLTVRYPFSYDKYSKVILTILTVIAWIIPLLISITCLNILSSVAFRHNVPTCLFYAPTPDKGLVFFSVMTSVSFLIGCILPTALYVWLYNKARKLRPSATKLGRMAVQIAAGTVIQVPLGPLDRDKHERRALITFMLIFITFFLTSAPLFFLQILHSISIDVWCEIPIYVHFILVQLFLSSTVLDPILIMRDRDFRKCLKRLLSCYGCRESDYDTAQYYASETYHSRRSDSVDMISYRGRRGSLCPSTGSASRMQNEANVDSLGITIVNDAENQRKSQLSTVHEHLSECTTVNTLRRGPRLLQHQDEFQVDGCLPVQNQDKHACRGSHGVNLNGCTCMKCTDTQSTDSELKEIGMHSYWTITWCQPVSSS